MTRAGTPGHADLVRADQLGRLGMHAVEQQDVRLTVGVDTHAENAVAAALDQLGRQVGTQGFAMTAAGYRALLAWGRRFGVVECFGIERTGSPGAGLARWLRAQGGVVEVARADRQERPASLTSGVKLGGGGAWESNPPSNRKLPEQPF